jgi:hypothetical protein
MLGWDQYKFDKKCIGHVTLNFCFSSGGICGSCSAFRWDRYRFFKLKWDRYEFDKKSSRTHYVELLLFHPVGSVGNVMHSGASGA